MREAILFSISLCFVFARTGDAQNQNDRQIGVILHTGYFPEFRIHNDHFFPSMAYGLQLYYYDADYTRLRYAFHYSRGYHRTVSYSTGFTAGYVIFLSDDFLLTPGLGFMDYKMKAWNCRLSVRSVLNTLFSIDEPCSEDSHSSFNTFVTAEWRVLEPFSILLRTGYRIMQSNVVYLKDEVTERLPDGTEVVRKIYGKNRSLYGAGLEFGIGIKIDLF